MGDIYALITALIWAGAVILFRRSGEWVPPFTLNFFRVTVASTLLVLTLAATGEPLWGRAPLEDYLLLFLSGIIAIAISDTLFHRSLNMVGAGVSAIIDCLYSPFTVLAAFMLLGERLGLWQLAGMGLVLAGVLTTARHIHLPEVSTRQLGWGVVWGVLAMATLALGIVIAKPVLNHSSVLWATTVRQIGCLAVMLPAALISRRRSDIFAAFRPSRSWRWSLPGAVLGSYVALIFWIAGMKYTQVGVASILNQSSTIYVLILASIFLHEPFTQRKLAASLLAMAGIALVTMG